MILIDKPFASGFLIDTIKKNNFEIVATPIAREMIPDDHLNWISEEKAIDTIKKNPDIKLYSNSENALGWVGQHLPESAFNKYAEIFKDKVKFRDILHNIYPDYRYLKVKLNEIDLLKDTDLPFPFVIKPSVGFFSVGVNIVRTPEEWQAVKAKLRAEKFTSIFPKNVLDTTYFIIEELIEGDEFAVDYYYNQSGEAVILNITNHLFASPTDTSDRVYFTSKEVVLQNEKKFAEFLHRVGQEIGVVNFPAHAEIRVTKSGQIIPIEINPMRFGGWCSTGEIPGLGIGYNIYEAYFQGIKPDWDEIFKGKEDKLYSIIILDNSSGIAPEQIKSFDYDLLASDFENPVEIRKFDIHKDPIFGFVFTETSKNNKQELYNILQSDLRKYITIKSE